MRVRIPAIARDVMAIAMTIMLGILPGVSSPARGAAQGGSAANSYSDDAFGFDVSWDADIWQPVDEASKDYLTIETTTTSLYFEGLAYSGTIDEAFAELTDPAAIEDGTTLTEWLPAENAAGKPLSGRSGKGRYGVFTYVFTDTGTEDSERRVAYIEVQPLVDGESVVAITAVTYDKAAYNDDIELVFAVIDTLAVTGEQPTEPEKDNPQIDDDVWIHGPLPVAA